MNILFSLIRSFVVTFFLFLLILLTESISSLSEFILFIPHFIFAWFLFFSLEILLDVFLNQQTPNKLYVFMIISSYIEFGLISVDNSIFDSVLPSIRILLRVILIGVVIVLILKYVIYYIISRRPKDKQP